MHHAGSIKRIGDRLSNPNVFENRIPQIEGDISDTRARSVHRSKVWLLLKRPLNVGRECIDLEVGASFTQFKSSRRRVRDNDEANPFDFGVRSPIIVISCDYNVAVLFSAHELEWP